jgi:hypothetical protein
MQLGYLSHATAEEGRQVEEFSLTLSLGHPLFTAPLDLSSSHLLVHYSLPSATPTIGCIWHFLFESKEKGRESEPVIQQTVSLPLVGKKERNQLKRPLTYGSKPHPPL